MYVCARMVVKKLVYCLKWKKVSANMAKLLVALLPKEDISDFHIWREYEKKVILF